LGQDGRRPRLSHDPAIVGALRAGSQMAVWQHHLRPRGGLSAVGRRAFRALVSDGAGGCHLREVAGPEELPRQDPGAEVTVRVTHSTINYKDAMVVKGLPGVVKGWPIVPGIDAAGVAESVERPAGRSAGLAPGFSVGDAVTITGNKLGQHFDGGYSGVLRVKAGWCVRTPAPFSAAQSMAIGSAGHTAMMCVAHLEEHGDLRRWIGRDDAPVLVTGAGGGLGAIATAILAHLGYKVHASTGRPAELGGFLTSLGPPGAVEVVPRLDHDAVRRPLGRQTYGGVVDAVGGAALASAAALTRYRCAVASVGVAGGGGFEGTVYPLILRGVRILGIDTTLPWDVDGYEEDPETWLKYREERLRLWERLASDLPAAALERCTTRTVSLEDVPAAAAEVLAGRHAGRIVVEL